MPLFVVRPVSGVDPETGVRFVRPDFPSAVHGQLDWVGTLVRRDPSLPGPGWVYLLRARADISPLGSVLRGPLTVAQARGWLDEEENRDGVRFDAEAVRSWRVGRDDVGEDLDGGG